MTRTEQLEVLAEEHENYLWRNSTWIESDNRESFLAGAEAADRLPRDEVQALVDALKNECSCGPDPRYLCDAHVAIAAYEAQMKEIGE